ncbi:MAG TPA: hypothetical protein VMW73_14150 [Spirochaetia bacterium]|nr:hypothetical protein [Spirochaetia bacterium]
MKIRAKLNSVFLVLVAGFVIALAVLLYFSTVTSALRELQLQSELVARDLFGLTDSTKTLITTSGTFVDAVAEWNNARKIFNLSLDRFQHEPGINFVDTDLKAQIAQTVTDWQPTSSQLTGAEQGIKTIVTSKEIADADRKGLDSIILLMTQEKHVEGELFFTLLTTRSRLLNADFGARTFMTKDLSSLEAALSKLVLDLTRTSRVISAGDFHGLKRCSGSFQTAILRFIPRILATTNWGRSHLTSM